MSKVTQIIKLADKDWHVLDPEKMKTTCCQKAVTRVEVAASQLPIDEPLCNKLPKP